MVVRDRWLWATSAMVIAGLGATTGVAGQVRDSVGSSSCCFGLKGSQKSGQKVHAAVEIQWLDGL